MKTVSMTYEQRLRVKNMIDSREPPQMRQLRVWFDLAKKLRLSDAEMEEATVRVVPMGDGQAMIRAADPAKLLITKELSFENEEMEELSQLLQRPAGIRTADGEWYLPLVDEVERARHNGSGPGQ